MQGEMWGRGHGGQGCGHEGSARSRLGFRNRLVSWGNTGTVTDIHADI